MNKTKSATTKRPRFYIAYGSNLDLSQMSYRCPTAKVVGATMLTNWRLRFRGEANAVATIERSAGYKVPVLVWQLQPKDERALDEYEGYPHLYRKETLRITVGGKRIYAMVYIMNEERHPYGAPAESYLSTIRAGYMTAGFDEVYLQHAIHSSTKQLLDPAASSPRSDITNTSHPETPILTDKIKQQILTIRQSGETNMFDINTVQHLANRERFYELVIFLEDHRNEYADFILTGGKSPE